jgi:16S rRNA (adenine1518-N6/adenine1519-N6)-dimethyltransferase
MKDNDIRTKNHVEKKGVRKSLGQNFLLDKNLARAIVWSLDFGKRDCVVEIGPGHAALTVHLVERKPARLLAIEKDRELAAALRERFRGVESVEIREGDALDFDLRELWDGRPVRLIGNLPYNVATPLLRKFLAPDSPVRSAVVMVQKEVAERLCARPGCRAYGALTVLLGSRWRARILRTVPPTVFSPRPSVESAVVLLERLAPSEIIRCAASELEQRVRQGFSQRRKQLKKLLDVPTDVFFEAARALDFAPSARAEELSVEQWARLAALLADRSKDFGAHERKEIFDVVDSEDRVVDCLPREEVHARFLRHRSAHILLFNRRGEVFLQRRAPWKDINPGVWDSSAAGHVDSGEEYAACALRELREELGVEAELVRVGKLEPCSATGNEFIEVFTGQHEGPFFPNAWEIEGTGFFSWSRVREWVARAPEDFSPVFLECHKLIGLHPPGEKGS